MVESAGHQNRDQDSKNSLRSILASWIREPLVHFALLAGLLFLGSALISGSEKELIVIDAATQEYLFQRESDVLLRDLRQDEKQAIIDSFIEEELLVREARKRGFTDNSRVRALLVQNMRFFLREDVPDPTEEELIGFFQNNSKDFETPASLSFDQVFFNTPDDVPPSVLEDLRAGANFKDIGERTPLGPSPLVQATARQIANTFGPVEAQKVLAIGDDQWHGPFISSIGVHFLRVRERHEPVLPDYETVKDWVVMQWELSQHRERMESELTEIRNGYKVEIEPLAQGRI